QANARGKPKVVVESVETESDHDYVEYFRRVPGKQMLHTFRVVKLAPAFTLSIMMRNVRSKRVMYKVNNLDGCQFVNNPLMNKVMASTYNMLIVNNTFFKCPIEPRVYYLKNVDQALIMPSIHPLGHYQLTMRVKMAKSPAPFVMEILWNYKVITHK
ncbi:hypothetical protein KR222_001394, partial [Zaprionus bogoriensis]